MGASNSADIVSAITQGLSNMLFNIRPTVLPGCAANITFTPEVVTSVGVARVSEGRARRGRPTDVAMCLVLWVAACRDSGSGNC